MSASLAPKGSARVVAIYPIEARDLEPIPQLDWRSRSFTALMLLSLVLAGCPLSFTPERDPRRPDFACTPTVAGIVAAVNQEPIDEAIYTLEDGTEVRVARRPLRRFYPEPTVGDLLMYGESEECGAFLARAVPRDRPDHPGCLGISEYALDDGDFVLLESGLRLPKGDDFVTRGRYVSMSPVFCLNEHGEVVFFEHL